MVNSNTLVKRLKELLERKGLQGVLYKVYKALAYKYYMKRFHIRHDLYKSKRSDSWATTATFCNSLTQQDGGSRVSIIVIVEGRYTGNVENYITSIVTTTHYSDYEVVAVVPSGSVAARKVHDNLNHVSYRCYDESLGFAKAVNEVVANLHGEIIVLIGSNVHVSQGDWIAELLRCMSLPGVGVVSGVTLSGVSKRCSESWDLDSVISRSSCIMMRRETFLDCEGLNECYRTICSTLDLCARVAERGLHLVESAVLSWYHPYNISVDLTLDVALVRDRFIVSRHINKNSSLRWEYFEK